MSQTDNEKPMSTEITTKKAANSATFERQPEGIGTLKAPLTLARSKPLPQNTTGIINDAIASLEVFGFRLCVSLSV